MEDVYSISWENITGREWQRCWEMLGWEMFTFVGDVGWDIFDWKMFTFMGDCCK